MKKHNRGKGLIEGRVGREGAEDNIELLALRLYEQLKQNAQDLDMNLPEVHATLFVFTKMALANHERALRSSGQTDVADSLRTEFIELIQG